MQLEFQSAFEALTGNAPFPWQTRMFERMAAGDVPRECEIPTGLGKTAIIAVWLIARANSPLHVPRRLVYVVNRRTVVDQSTREAELIRQNYNALPALRENLGPLGISTLRGQFADNRAWCADPSKLAIIVGTVDMIGSRLLFSGYGIGYKSRPMHAAFLGQDAIVIHDEAHLEPAFQALLERIVKEQGRCRDGTPLRVLALSATARQTSQEEGDAGAQDGRFTLTDADHDHPEIARRTRAHKHLVLHEIDDEAGPSDRIAKLALVHEGAPCAVLVFTTRVEDVESIARTIRAAAQDRVETLTGTMRGLERDQLIEKDVFKRFLPGAPPGADTVYLVCTSAGEVGVNLSADHAVCDLSTFESMAQRFGRVNRFGLRDNTRIDVVYPSRFDEKDRLSPRRRLTLELLRALDGSANPFAISRLDPARRDSAYRPVPAILNVSDILFDAWSLTTIRGNLPGRPPVEPYLHGIAEWEPPRSQIAYREEVDVLSDRLLGESAPPKRKRDELLAELLADYPLKPHELLSDNSSRIVKRLRSLAKHSPSAPLWLLDSQGSVEIMRLGELLGTEVPADALVDDADEEPEEEGEPARKPRPIKPEDRIAGKTLLLPPSLGGLKGGLFTGGHADTANDVADAWLGDDGKPRRQRQWDDAQAPEGMRLVRIVDTRTDLGDGGDIEEEDLEESTADESTADEESAADESTADESAAGGNAARPKARLGRWYWYTRPRSADDDMSRTAREPVSWQDHTDDVVRNTSAIVHALPLSPELRRSFELAAECHDLGKRRLVWQKSIGNADPNVWLAKSGGKMKPIELTPYRHEFGSLLDLRDRPDFAALGAELKDLVLHVIATHHGHGRPHFEEDGCLDENYPLADLSRVARDVPGRFARLQNRYGRWGLAYLESLLRAADYKASAEPSTTTERRA